MTLVQRDHNGIPATGVTRHRHAPRMGVGMAAVSAVALGLTAAGAAMPSAAEAAEIAAHRAIYTLDLVSIVDDSHVADARGALVVEWRDVCDGWQVEQHYALYVSHHEQPDRRIESSYSTWESKDGLTYTFDVETSHDGRGGDRVRGSATLDPETGAGEAEYARPRGVTVELPAGTMFPMAHTREVLGQAENGGVVINRVVFDGSNVDQPLEMNVLVGARVNMGDDPSPQLAADSGNPLLEAPGWNIRMAIFPMTSVLAVPDYEIEVGLLNNGVAQTMLLDYGDFIMSASLRQIEALPAEVCE